MGVLCIIQFPYDDLRHTQGYAITVQKCRPVNLVCELVMKKRVRVQKKRHRVHGESSLLEYNPDLARILAFCQFAEVLLESSHEFLGRGRRTTGKQRVAQFFCADLDLHQTREHFPDGMDEIMAELVRQFTTLQERVDQFPCLRLKETKVLLRRGILQVAQQGLRPVGE